MLRLAISTSSRLGCWKRTNNSKEIACKNEKKSILLFFIHQSAGILWISFPMGTSWNLESYFRRSLQFLYGRHNRGGESKKNRIIQKYVFSISLMCCHRLPFSKLESGCDCGTTFFMHFRLRLGICQKTSKKYSRFSTKCCGTLFSLHFFHGFFLCIIWRPIW